MMILLTEAIDHDIKSQLKSEYVRCKNELQVAHQQASQQVMVITDIVNRPFRYRNLSHAASYAFAHSIVQYHFIIYCMINTFYACGNVIFITVITICITTKCPLNNDY